MKQFIEDKIKELSDINQNILNNWQEISKKEEEHKKAMEILHQKNKDKAQEGIDLKNTLVSFNVGELAEELKKQLGIPNIYCTLETSVFKPRQYDKDELIQLVRKEQKKYDSYLITYRFYMHPYGGGVQYMGTSKLDFDAIQADGKPLVDHCKVRCQYGGWGGYSTTIEFDNYKDIILTEKLGNLITENGTIVEPNTRIISQAILNVAKEYKPQKRTTTNEEELNK